MSDAIVGMLFVWLSWCVIALAMGSRLAPALLATAVLVVTVWTHYQ